MGRVVQASRRNRAEVWGPNRAWAGQAWVDPRA